eukprot:m.125901 g.125901  ORF g.125901 m.125901 type:complete len:531 (+) comp29164_c0_seq3:356-1948(+)
MGQASTKQTKSEGPRISDTFASPFRQALVAIHKDKRLPLTNGRETEISKRYYGFATSPIGEGATSQTRIVTHKISGNKFACKSVRLLSIPRMAKRQLLAEIQIIRELDHPHIVQVFEVFEQIDYLHIVMELCAGGEMFDKLLSHPNSRMTEAQVKPLLWQMLSAVNYLHQNGVVHRDLKLENFLLTGKGKSETVKLIDFGYSSSFVEGKPLTEFCGTPYYMAPEVVGRKYSNASDLWSMGVITYMLLTGEPPIYGNTNTETIRNIESIAKYPLNFGYKASQVQGLELSSDAQVFINALMDVNVSTRLTATQAMKHRWLKKKRRLTRKKPKKNQVHAAVPSRVVVAPQEHHKPSGFAMKLAQFHDMNEYTRAAIKVTAFFSQQDKDMSTLTEVFHSIDENGDGTLSYTEFHKFLSSYLHQVDSSINIEKAFQAVTGGPNLQIKFSDFVSACEVEKLCLQRENAVNTFRCLDLDGDGFITKDELQKKMRLDSDQSNSLNLEGFFEHVDVLVKDGRIDLHEFTHLMQGSALKS